MQQQMSFLDSQFGKTFRAHFQAQAENCGEKISDAYSKSSCGSTSRQPRCLRLIKEDGLTQTLSWVTDGRLLTEFSMQVSGESPSVVAESTLSQILEVNVPEKYYLSAKACEGILRRASKRGKELPEMLRIALEQQIERMSE